LEYILNNTSVAINNDTNLSMIFAMELVKLGIADFPIAGAVEKSNSLIKSSLNILKLNKKYSRISSFFIMIPKAYHAHNKSKIKLNNIINSKSLNKKELQSALKNSLFFSDCSVQINPDSTQLSEIAFLTSINASNAIKPLAPSIALLSYSTIGSGKGESVDKVAKATQLLKLKLNKNKLHFDVDGELQVDAALNEFVRLQKKSRLKHNANVLIFPNLDSGNIGYKLVEYLGNYYAIGPILQGLNTTVGDLSRGVTSDEIVLMAKILCCYDFE